MRLTSIVTSVETTINLSLQIDFQINFINRTVIGILIEHKYTFLRSIRSYLFVYCVKIDNISVIQWPRVMKRYRFSNAFTDFIDNIQ